MSRQRSPRGQSFTEMAVILAIVGIATLLLVTVFGGNMHSLFGGSSDALAGNTSVANGGEKAGSPLRNLSSFAGGATSPAAGAGGSASGGGSGAGSASGSSGYSLPGTDPSLGDGPVGQAILPTKKR